MRRNPLPANAYEQAIYESEASEARDSAAFDDLLTTFRKTLIAGAKDKVPTPGQAFYVNGVDGRSEQCAPVHVAMGEVLSSGKHADLEAGIYKMIGLAASGCDVKASALALVEAMGWVYATQYHRDHELGEEDDFDIDPVEMSAWGGE